MAFLKKYLSGENIAMFFLFAWPVPILYFKQYLNRIRTGKETVEK